MLSLVLLLLTAPPKASKPPIQPSLERTHDLVRASRAGGRLGGLSAAFELAPPNGVGMPATAGCYASTAITGAKGEVMTFPARSTVAETYSNDGQTITQCTTTQVRVASGSATSSQLGLLIDAYGTTNLLWPSRDLSNVNWVKTNMTCTRTANGMRGGDANGATTCTATAANATVCQTVVALAASRTSSWHLKRRTGTGAVTLSRDNFTTTTANLSASLSSSLWRRAVPFEATGCAGGNCILDSALTGGGANPVDCLKLAVSGDAVDIDFVQDETAPVTGPVVTNPVETTVAAASRGAETGVYFTTATPFNLRSMRAEFQTGHGDVGTSYRAVLGGWQDASHITTFYGDTTREPNCDFYDGALHTQGAIMFTPLSGTTFTQWNCDYVDGATTAQLSLQGVVQTSTGATAANTALVTRIYVGSSPLGGTHAMPSVIRSVCADPSVGRCAAKQFNPGGSPILAVGDSITQGVAQIPTQWTYQLNLSQNRAVYTLGQTGLTASVCRDNYLSYIAWHPEVTTVTVICGVNSLIAGDSGASIMTTLQQIFDDARARGLKLKIGTILPWAAYASSSAPKQTETTNLNTALLNYCSTYSAQGVSCVNFFTSSLNDGSGNLAATYDSGDHIHPNAAGGVYMETLWRAVFP